MWIFLDEFYFRHTIVYKQLCGFLCLKKGVILLKNWYYALLVFLGGCCYGILSTFVKLAYSAGFSSPEVTSAEYFFGTLLIYGVVIFTKKEKLTIKQILKLLLAGVPFGLTGLFYYQSLKTLNASMAIIFLFQFVWIGTLFDWIFNKKKPTKKKLISIFILVVGSILAANVLTHQGAAISVKGIIFGLLASLSYSTSMFFSSSVENDIPPVLKSALLSTGSLIVVCALFPPTFLFHFSVLKGLTPYGLILGLFGVALPPLLFSIGLPHIGPSLGSILSASELPVAVTMSVLVLSEHISIPQLIGIILILVGIISCNIRSRKNNADSTDTPKSAAV